MSGTGGDESGPKLDIAPWPRDDFAAYGPLESKPITRIQKIVGTMLSRNWVMIINAPRWR